MLIGFIVFYIDSLYLLHIFGDYFVCFTIFFKVSNFNHLVPHISVFTDFIFKQNHFILLIHLFLFRKTFQYIE